VASLSQAQQWQFVALFQFNLDVPVPDFGLFRANLLLPSIWAIPNIYGEGYYVTLTIPRHLVLRPFVDPFDLRCSVPPVRRICYVVAVAGGYGICAILSYDY